ncbi:uncharacterized protein EHS24_006838 [Apiotrichum porosum]|uniref:Uncharacterized protein n=1 Tax=Apiotrichum porosum TaxID=105984 RepID=A0A427XWB4_9TREE|nr:uncharacterized protein EHS24_006838 [Apiotrichum porosum]RSH83178.1 hypothetical protein EHS24_006838 [Apiotrichum porosum]
MTSNNIEPLPADLKTLFEYDLAAVNQKDPVFEYPSRSLVALGRRHEGVTERQFNNDLLAIQRYYVGFDRHIWHEGKERPHGFHIRLDSDISLFRDILTPLVVNPDSDTSPPYNVSFGNTPTQLQVEKLVRLHRGTDTTLPRSALGCYIPDWVVSAVAAEPEVVGAEKKPRWFHRISLVGELKITSVGYTNKQWKVRSSIDDDVDGDVDVDTHSAIVDNNRKYSPLASTDQDELVRTDMFHKWQAGLSKLIVYMKTAYEYCGSFLGFSIIHTNLQRAVVLPGTDSVPTLVLEWNETGIVPITDISQFFDDKSNVKTMPFDLRGATEGQFDPIALSSLLEITALAFEVLSSTETAHPFGPISRPDRQRCPTIVEVEDFVSDRSRHGPMTKSVMDKAICEARAIPTSHGGSTSDPSTSKQPSGGPGGDPGADGSSGPGRGQGGGGGSGNSGPKTYPVTGTQGRKGAHGDRSGGSGSGSSKKPRQHTQQSERLSQSLLGKVPPPFTQDWQGPSYLSHSHPTATDTRTHRYSLTESEPSHQSDVPSTIESEPSPTEELIGLEPLTEHLEMEEDNEDEWEDDDSSSLQAEPGTAPSFSAASGASTVDAEVTKDEPSQVGTVAQILESMGLTQSATRHHQMPEGAFHSAVSPSEYLQLMKELDWSIVMVDVGTMNDILCEIRESLRT